MNDSIDEVFAFWKELLCHKRAQLDAARSRVIGARLKDGYSVDDLKTAIEGCAKSAWHMGDNPRATRYDALTLILRDAEHVDKFIAIAERPIQAPKKVETFRERDLRREMEEWEQWTGRTHPDLARMRMQENSNVIDITPKPRMELIA